MEQKDSLPKAAQIATGTCFKVIDFLLQELRTNPENALKYYAETGKYVFINESYNKIVVNNISSNVKKAQLYSIFKNSAYYFYEFDRFDHDNVISVNMYGYLSIKNKENDTPKQIIRRLDFLQLSPGNFEVIVDFTRTIEPMGKNTVTSLSPPKGYTSKKDNFGEVLKNVEEELNVKNVKVSEYEQKVTEKKKEIELKKAKLEALKKQIAEKEKEEALNAKKPSELLSKLNTLEKKPPAKLIDKTKSLQNTPGKIISGGSNTDSSKLIKSPAQSSQGSLSPQPQNKKKPQAKEAGDKKSTTDNNNSTQNNEKKEESKKNINKTDNLDDDGSWEVVANSKSNNYKDNKRKNNGNNHYKNDGSGNQGYKKNSGNKNGFQSDLNKKPKHKI